MNKISIGYLKTRIGEFILGSIDDKLCLCDHRFRKMRSAIDKRLQGGIQAVYFEQETLTIALAKKQINDLARSTLKISQQAYATGGITNAPALVKKLKQQGLRRGQYRHTVFSRENQDCYTCGETILKEAISSRRLYWCPLCQY